MTQIFDIVLFIIMKYQTVFYIVVNIGGGGDGVVEVV